jgi:hypothetical protein
VAIVWVDSDQFFILLWGFIGLVITVVVVGAGWMIWWFKLTSKDVREFRKATRHGNPINCQVDDAGQAELVEIRKVAPTGYGKTSGKWLGIFPRKQVEEQTETADKPILVKLSSWLNELATKKATLRHSKTLIWFSYKGKGIFTTLYALMGLQTLENMVEGKVLPNGGEPLKVGSQIIELFDAVDLQKVKGLFPKNWDESELQGLESDSEMTGIKIGQKFKGTAEKMFFWVGLAMLIAGVALAAVAIFFK